MSLDLALSIKSKVPRLGYQFFMGLGQLREGDHQTGYILSGMSYSTQQKQNKSDIDSYSQNESSTSQICFLKAKCLG